MTIQPASTGFSSTRRHLLVALSLAVLTLLLFVQAVRFDFINFDDFDYVVRNQRVLRGLSLDNVRWAFTTLKLANWHPITWLSHMTDATLFGAAPAGHHLTSVLLHAVNVMLLYLVLAYMTGNARRSLLVAALFAAHPLRMESVAWVSERKDLLSGFFFFLTLAAYTRYARTRSLGWYALATLALGLGLMSKPMLVTAPCVLLLLDFWPLDRFGRDSIRRLILEKLPLLAMSAAISAVTYVAQQKGGAVGEERHYPLSLRLANAIWAYGQYLRKTVWPNDLAIFYPYVGVTPESPFPWWRAVVYGIILLALTAVAVRLWRSERAVLIGWLWFIGMLVPTIGLVQVGGQSLADRYTYLPHIGLFIAIVWGVGSLTQNSPAIGRAAQRAAAVAVVALAIVTAMQLKYWQNTITLFDRAVHVTDRNARAHVSLALWYTQHGQHDLAVGHYRDALRFEPGNPQANNNYGNMLVEVGRTDEGREHLVRAVRAQPRYAEAHNNLANLLAQQGKTEQAIRHHEAAIHWDPELAAAHYNYGLTLARIGKLAAAQPRLERALQLKPDHPEARYTYGLVMAGLGYEVAATDQLREANFLRRDWFDALRSLAWLLATSPEPKVRNGAQAVIVAERANQLTGYENPVALDTLAAAYAEAGRFDNAIATAARAEQIARSAGQNDLADRFAKRLELYRSGKPFHRVAGAT
ncbi:MAG: protein O-mannosyl-transferase, partial [Phycisphaerales bacterium]|nr:protein O-mannosyl-transferase [Phycisphaerales bacterium]